MKTLLCIILFVIMSIDIFAQKTITIDIFKKGLVEEYLNAKIIENNTSGRRDTIIIFFARNHKYQHITDMITLYSGSCKRYSSFMNDVIEFAKQNESGTSNTFDHHIVSLGKTMGIKSVSIFNKEGMGYHTFTVGILEKFKKEFLNWCKKNNVCIDSK